MVEFSHTFSNAISSMKMLISNFRFNPTCPINSKSVLFLDELKQIRLQNDPFAMKFRLELSRPLLNAYIKLGINISKGC